MKKDFVKKPEWLRMTMQSNHNYSMVHKTVKDNDLHTICKSGRCPNISECWNRGTATFMILGEICTRACRFCNVITGKPLPLNPEEPVKLGESIRLMKLKHAVITSVDRDDLPDKGAGQWAETIRVVKEMNPGLTLEVLIPDFDGDTDLVDLVIAAKPDVISHNLETVRRLTPRIRSRAKYDTSLKVLKHVADRGVVSKTGIMLGLGEAEEEILELMDDALQAGCSVLTIGQYMRPSRQNIQVSEYIHPDKFAEYKQVGLQKGFRIVESAPFVRSSYGAEKHLL